MLRPVGRISGLTEPKMKKQTFKTTKPNPQSSPIAMCFWCPVLTVLVVWVAYDAAQESHHRVDVPLVWAICIGVALATTGAWLALRWLTRRVLDQL